jgi:hypothetical protein
LFIQTPGGTTVHPQLKPLAEYRALSAIVSQLAAASFESEMENLNQITGITYRRGVSKSLDAFRKWFHRSQQQTCPAQLIFPG